MVSFSAKELRFLKEEFGLSPEDVKNLTEEELLDLSDQCFDIELEGNLSDGNKMPDRCGIAAGIIDKLNEI